MTRSLALRLLAPCVLIGTNVACDYTGEWLFAGVVEGVPGIIHINAEDGGPLLTPVSTTVADEVNDLVIYGELGPTGTAARGGATFNFIGTGGPVCIFVDPETIFWGWSVSPQPDDVQKAFSYPDNVFDDGDIDLFVGLSAYYTGSPGVEVGDFFVSYTDSLGNEVPIELSECSNIGLNDQSNAHAGRGFPEMCNLQYTDPGVSYTGLLQTFSTPLDDDRLGFGLVVWDGTCTNLISVAAEIPPTSVPDAPAAAECVVEGESVIPRPLKDGDLTYCTGEGCLDAWPEAVGFEREFCAGGAGDLRSACKKESRQHFESGFECEWETIENVEGRCFCGDPNDIPQPGAL